VALAAPVFDICRALPYLGASQFLSTFRQRELTETPALPGPDGETMREVVATENAPRPIGPYSQAIKANGFIFMSGQTPLDPVTQQLVAGGITEQTERALKNLAAVLKAAGSSLDKVVRCGVFLKDLNDFAAMNEVYCTFFKGNPPARTTVQAARLPKDCMVEIDAIALA
jgi:2-iminobutanoate/2-iminopropanoate deaminase